MHYLHVMHFQIENDNDKENTKEQQCDVMTGEYVCVGWVWKISITRVFSLSFCRVELHNVPERKFH